MACGLYLASNPRCERCGGVGALHDVTEPQSVVNSGRGALNREPLSHGPGAGHAGNGAGLAAHGPGARAAKSDT